jgi:hypothetical protein
MSLFSQIFLGNEIIIGWILFSLAELILVCSVKVKTFFIISVLFYIGLMLINL